jgi:predicted metallopeptidase
MKVSVSDYIRRMAFDWPLRPKSDEEQLARAMFRIIKEKAEAQGLNPKYVIDYLERMKEKIKGPHRG